LEEGLEEAKRFFGDLLANNSIAAAMVRSDSGRFLKVNSVFCTLIGLSQNEICGRTTAEIHVRLLDINQQDLFQIRDGSVPIQNVEARIERRDGQLIDVLVSAKATSFDRKSCVLLTLLDLTDVRRLKKQVIDIAEQEQRRFSRDLHDGHCQDLTAMVFFAENLAASLEETDPDSANQVRVLAKMIQRSAENVHALAAGLSFQKIEQSGLDDALTELAFRNQQQFRITCTTTIAERGRISDDALAVHLYRIAQEAVSNAARHGRPENIEIQLSFKEGQGVLRVADNGIGFAVKDKKSGLGLDTMEYRAGVIKGTLHVDSEPGKGTVVTCLFPL